MTSFLILLFMITVRNFGKYAHVHNVMNSEYTLYLLKMYVYCLGFMVGIKGGGTHKKGVATDLHHYQVIMTTKNACAI